MPAAHFSIVCDRCGERIEIRRVAVFRHDLYSYGYKCRCGAQAEVDGTDGSEIPAELKRAAQQQHRASQVGIDIDLQRRDLPQSKEKSLLRDARVDIPIEVRTNSWLVYDFPDRLQICYETDSKIYSLLAPGENPQVFASLEPVIQHLEKRISSAR